MTARDTSKGSDLDGGQNSFIHTGTAAILFSVVILATHGFGNSLVPALLPRIAESFQTGYGALGLAVAAGTFSYGAGAVLGIRIVDRFPSRGLLIACLGVCGAGFFAAATAGSAGTLAICVVIIGLMSPVSWAVSVYLVAQVVRPEAHGRVLAIAGAGAGVGTGVNGVFVQSLTGPGQWRWAFVIAGGAAVLMILVSLMVLRRPVAPPMRGEKRRDNAWRMIWSMRPGRLVLLVSMVVGVTSFTFASYLSEVALDELHVSSLAAAVPWWLGSMVGISSALPAGLLIDRGRPMLAISITALIYTLTLTILAVTWSYPALLMATFGYAIFNFPLWGVLGWIAHRSMRPELAVRAVSGGLAMAAWAAMAGVALSGWWIDRTGTFKGPVIMLAVIMAAATIWLAFGHLAESSGRLYRDDDAHAPGTG